MTYIPAPLRRLVFERARGCCEYRRLGQASRSVKFHGEHIIPEQHLGTTTEDNLCLSCPHCNWNKGSNFASIDPETGQFTPLFNPRNDTWSDHFQLDHAKITPRSPVGRVTVLLLKFNSQERINERAILIEEGLYPCQ